MVFHNCVFTLCHTVISPLYWFESNYGMFFVMDMLLVDLRGFCFAGSIVALHSDLDPLMYLGGALLAGGCFGLSLCALVVVALDPQKFLVLMCGLSAVLWAMCSCTIICIFAWSVGILI
ncbi:hypothetical protein U1Q18_001416 [Sarracenia purpurea var. burkii]